MMGISYETAWFLFHRLREGASDMAPVRSAARIDSRS